MAPNLVSSDCELPARMTAGRWSSSAMSARYNRNESAGRRAVAQYYGGSTA